MQLFVLLVFLYSSSIYGMFFSNDRSIADNLLVVRGSALQTFLPRAECTICLQGTWKSANRQLPASNNYKDTFVCPWPSTQTTFVILHTYMHYTLQYIFRYIFIYIYTCT